MNRYLRLFLQLVGYLVCCVVMMALCGLPVYGLVGTLAPDSWVYLYANELAMLVAFLLPSWLFLRGHWAKSMGFVWRGHDFCAGALVAIMLYAVGFSLLLIFGELRVVDVSIEVVELLISWLFMLVVAVAEEAALRGFVLGRMLDAGMNRFVALFLSAFLFSALHLFNPNFAFLPFLNILLSGMLLGATYIYTRNLTFPIALHLFWNWLQGPVLGFQVSGNTIGTTMLTLQLPEPTVWNGGAFGFEGSLLCSLLVVVAIAWIVYRKGKV